LAVLPECGEIPHYRSIEVEAAFFKELHGRRGGRDHFGQRRQIEHRLRRHLRSPFVGVVPVAVELYDHAVTADGQSRPRKRAAVDGRNHQRVDPADLLPDHPDLFGIAFPRDHLFEVHALPECIQPGDLYRQPAVYRAFPEERLGNGLLRRLGAAVRSQISIWRLDAGNDVRITERDQDDGLPRSDDLPDQRLLIGRQADSTGPRSDVYEGRDYHDVVAGHLVQDGYNLILTDPRRDCAGGDHIPAAGRAELLGEVLPDLFVVAVAEREIQNLPGLADQRQQPALVAEQRERFARDVLAYHAVFDGADQPAHLLKIHQPVV